MAFKLTILTFHRVTTVPYFIPPMAVHEKTFVRLIKRLPLLGCVMALPHAVAKIKNGTLKGNCFAITFDDGYADNYMVAAKILSYFNMPATFFVPVLQINTNAVFWWDYIYSIVESDASRFHAWICDAGVGKLLNNHTEQALLAREIVQIFNGMTNEKRLSILDRMSLTFGEYSGSRLLMNWDEIKHLGYRGFEIGSHTVSHIPLTDLSDEDAIIEIAQSKKYLSEKIGLEVSGFCYPRGAFSRQHLKMVEKSQYKYAVSTRFGNNSAGSDIYALSRRTMADYPDFRNHLAPEFQLLELSGIFDRILLKRRIA